MLISGDFTPMITQAHEQLRDKRELCAGLRPGGPRCRTWLADNLHFGSVNTDALPLCGPIQGVQNCMCDWARSQAGATAATHRPTCRLGRALTLRFVTLAVRSLSRSTEWCSARQFLLVKCCLRVLTTRVSRAPPVLRRMSWRPRERVIQLAFGTVCTLLSLGVWAPLPQASTCKRRHM